MQNITKSINKKACFNKVIQDKWKNVKQQHEKYDCDLNSYKHFDLTVMEHLKFGCKFVCIHCVKMSSSRAKLLLQCIKS